MFLDVDDDIQQILNSFERESRNKEFFPKEKFEETPTLENLISFHQTKNSKDDEEDKNRLPLKKFKEININKFIEDILYYCSSPETLKNYKRSEENERNYEFFKDLECEEFLSSQKRRAKTISSISKLNSFIKKKKLSNYNDSLCANGSFVQKNNEKSSKMVNANLIRKKMEEYGMLFLKENDENKMIQYLSELKEIFKKNQIDMESLGLVHFKIS